MLDISRTRYQLTTNKLVLSTISVQGILDGSGLVYALEDGIQKVHNDANITNDSVFAGVAFSQYRAQSQSTKVEKFKVPAGGGSVTLAAEPVDGVSKVTVSIDGATAVNPQAGAPSSAGQVQLVGNVMTFHANDAEKEAVVTYRYNLTVAEIEGLPYMGDGIPGIAVTAATQSVSVIQRGEVYTDQFDTGVDWNTVKENIKCGPNGIFTKGDSATGAPVNGTVCFVPTVDCPFLGIELF